MTGAPAARLLAELLRRCALHGMNWTVQQAAWWSQDSEFAVAPTPDTPAERGVRTYLLILFPGLNDQGAMVADA
jgi:hypothetical protein